MLSLVYKSRASPAFSENQVQNMLDQARKSNHENEIIGCLLYYQGEFLQYLEGEKVRISNLFSKIKEDVRHTDVELLSTSEILGRVFENWEMAYENFLGNNHQLQYLKILTSSFMEDPPKILNPNPTSNSFWMAAQKILYAKSIENS